MTLFVPDVNVLVYAFRADSANHSLYSDWLNGALRTDRIGVADTILGGFVRIVTHPRVSRHAIAVSRDSPISDGSTLRRRVATGAESGSSRRVIKAITAPAQRHCAGLAL